MYDHSYYDQRNQHNSTILCTTDLMDIYINGRVNYVYKHFMYDLNLPGAAYYAEKYLSLVDQKNPENSTQIEAAHRLLKDISTKASDT